TAPAQPPRSPPPARERLPGGGPPQDFPPVPPDPGGQGADREPMVKRLQEMMANHLFKLVDTNDDGQITAEEWMALFQKAAKGKNHLTPDDLFQVMVRKRSLKEPVRALGLAKAETGSFFEGPGVGQIAPDFTLKTRGRKHEIRLSQYRGRKPVVLVFGSYT